jgi:hypothetical protein
VWGALAAACEDPRAVRVNLQAIAVPPGSSPRVAVQAQITGPPAGLWYQWFAASGSCDPQQGPAPSTECRLVPGAGRDRVTVEVWRDSVRVARADVEVRADRGAEPGPAPTDARVSITDVPPYDPDGGPDTRASIAGRVAGAAASSVRVVLYARADAWYVQPTPHAALPVAADGRWASWTHLGSSYAALVVRLGYEPYARLDVLPAVGGDVIARTVVEGRRR